MPEEVLFELVLSWGRRKVSPAGNGRSLAIGEGALNQALYINLELIQRHRTRAKYRVVEGADIKLLSERFLSHLA